MGKILIATRNEDKFKIVKKMLEDISNNKFQFVNLRDLKINKDTEEIGDILERAEQKARLLINDVEQDITGIIGIDDGIKIKGNTTPETKKEADKILSGNYLELDEVVCIVRGLFMINTKTNEYESCLNEIPFKYIEDKTQIKRVEGAYPLSYVLGRLEKNKAIAYDTEDESHRYYMDYSKKGIKKLFQIF